MPAYEPAFQQQIETLYADHHGWLQAWLRRKLGNTHQAADLAHDTFVRIMASHNALLGMQTPRAYLATTARRLLVDHSRRQLIEQAYLAELSLLAETLPGYPSPDEILMAVQALAQISIALDSLPAKAREAFLRHYLEAQPQADIAIALGVSKRMVQKYLAQALLHCRTRCPAMAERGA